jgi:serine protease AprX
MNRLIRFFRFSFVLAALTPLAVSAQNNKISADAVTAAANGPVQVIVQYNTDPGTQQETLLTVKHHGFLRNTLHSIQAHAATLQPADLQSLANDPSVKYISLDRWVGSSQSVTVTPGVVLTGANYTVEPIKAPQVWAQGYYGTGIGIAIIDSGITPVDDLSTNSNGGGLLGGVLGLLGWGGGNNYRIVYNQNFVPTTVSVLDMSASTVFSTNYLDQYGHGTHVAGLVAGNGDDSNNKNDFRTFYGSAPNANLINLRVLDQNGNGTDSQVIAAIERATALKSKYNIRVINLSLGRPIWESYTLDPLCQAVEQAWKAGIVVVVSAGNAGRDQNLNSEGYGTIEAPGNDPYVITVGAMNTEQTPGLGDDVIATYSSKGPTFIDHFS